MDRNNLMHYLFPKESTNGLCYAIIDAAQISKLNYHLIGEGIIYVNLLNDEDADKLESVAPFLIQLDPNHPFTTWVTEHVYGKNGAIFFHSHHRIESLKQHLQSYIYVSKEVTVNNRVMHQKGYLAYYDPRVFSEWISSIAQEEQNNFFSPIHRVYAEAFFEKSELLIYQFDGVCSKISVNLHQMSSKVQQ